MELAFHQIVTWLTDGKDRLKAKKLFQNLSEWPSCNEPETKIGVAYKCLKAQIQQELHDEHVDAKRIYNDLFTQIKRHDWDIPHVKHRVLRGLITSCLVINELDSAVYYARLSYEVRKSNSEKYACDFVHDCFLYAYCLIENGMDDDALPIAQEAITLATDECPENSIENIDAHRIMGYFYVKSHYKATRALPFYLRALRKSLARNDADRAFKSLYYICRTGVLSNDQRIIDDHLFYFDTIYQMADEIAKVKIRLAKLDVEHSMQVRGGDINKSIETKKQFLNVLREHLPERTTAIFDGITALIEKYILIDDKPMIQFYLLELENFASVNELNKNQKLNFFDVKSTALSKLGQWQLAKLEADKGLDELVNFKTYNQKEFPSINEISDLFYYRKYLMILAQYHADKYKSSGSIMALKDQYRYLNQVVVAIMAMIEKDDERVAIQAQKEIAADFENLILITLRLSKVNDDPEYVTKAFQLAELASNLTFLRGRKRSTSITRNPLSDSLIAKKRHLQKSLSMKTDFTLSDATLYKEHEMTRLDDQLELSKIDLLLESTEPLYMSNIRAIKSLDVQAFQKNYLTTQSAYIKLFSYNHVFAFVVLPDTVHCVHFPLDYEMSELLNGYIRVSSAPNCSVSDFSHFSRSLYLKLFDPIEKLLPNSVSHLCIAPYGQFSNISFEGLLIDESLNKLNFSTLPYLINKYSVSYSYSAIDLINYNSNVSDEYVKILAVSPRYLLKQDDTQLWVRESADSSLLLSPLRGALDEIKEICKIIPGSTMLSGDRATKAQVQSELREHSVWHFAMHAQVADEYPMENCLIFPRDAINDRRLTAAEVYAMNVEAEMVVLSACNTGVGKIDYRNGSMSLSRAFAFSGARSTVLSLWQSPDQSTADIFPIFYEMLQNGYPKNKALQLAKTAYVKNSLFDELAHPFYWNGITIWGDTSPVKLRTNWLDRKKLYVLCALLTWAIAYMIHQITAKRKMK